MKSHSKNSESTQSQDQLHAHFSFFHQSNTQPNHSSHSNQQQNATTSQQQQALDDNSQANQINNMNINMNMNGIMGMNRNLNIQQRRPSVIDINVVDVNEVIDTTKPTPAPTNIETNTTINTITANTTTSAASLPASPSHQDLSSRANNDIIISNNDNSTDVLIKDSLEKSQSIDKSDSDSENSDSASEDLEMDIDMMELDDDEDNVKESPNQLLSSIKLHLAKNGLNGASSSATTVQAPVVPSALVNSASVTTSPTTTTSSKKAPSLLDLISVNKRSTSPNKISKQSLPISKRFRSRSLPNIFLHTDFVLKKKSTTTTTTASATSTSTSTASTSKHGSSSKSHSRRRKHRHHHHHHHISSSSPTSLLPPVNLNSLHEIDLNEILKNPQLRHDILFDPELQFRPNLDGDRGKRKNQLSDKYWLEVRYEINALLRNADPETTSAQRALNSNVQYLPIMFQTLKEIFLSLLPTNDKLTIDKTFDINLILQQLSFNCFNFQNFSSWLSGVLKLHCAPMRDCWVDEMNDVFHSSDFTNKTPNSPDVDTLIQGLRMLFAILEAMKLDVANHQIRILRPALCNTAISFEKDYFNGIISKQKINIKPSLQWFEKNYSKLNSLEKTNESSSSSSSSSSSLKFEKCIVFSIVNLLSCQSMYPEFPCSLIFDHSRLVILRADIRQIVCIKIVLILYKQLIGASKNLSNQEKQNLLSMDKQLSFKNEILSIIIDDNGNSKWTRNLQNLAIQIVSKLNITDSTQRNSQIEFSYNWLLKQTQPNSKIYSLIENQLFEKLINKVELHQDVNSIVISAPSNAKNPAAKSTSSTTSVVSTQPPKITASTTTTTANASSSTPTDVVDVEFSSMITRLETLISFHWNVFDEIYMNHINNKE